MKQKVEAKRIIDTYSAALSDGFVPFNTPSRGKEGISASGETAKRLGISLRNVQRVLSGRKTYVNMPGGEGRLTAQDGDSAKEILNFINEAKSPGLEPFFIPKLGEKNDLIPILLLSDWHYGETIDPNQVFGYNKFNKEIAEKRLEKLLTESIRSIKRFSDSDKVFIWLGGDFISGWLHDELIASDFCTPLEAIAWCCNALFSFLKALAECFKGIVVYCSPGNHGRLMKKPPAKLSVATSFDWLLYAQLKNWLREDSRIAINIPQEGDCFINFPGQRFLFTHGHQLGVKGGDGIIGALGPIFRGAVKAKMSLNSLNRSFDTMIIGHYHQFIWMPNQGIIVNPAFIGYSEFSRINRFPAEPPAQLLFFLNEYNKPVLPIPILLGE